MVGFALKLYRSEVSLDNFKKIENTGNFSVLIKMHSVASLYQDCHLPKSLCVCSDFSPLNIFTLRVWFPQWRYPAYCATTCSVWTKQCLFAMPDVLRERKCIQHTVHPLRLQNSLNRTIWLKFSVVEQHELMTWGHHGRWNNQPNVCKAGLNQHWD